VQHMSTRFSHARLTTVRLPTLEILHDANEFRKHHSCTHHRRFKCTQCPFQFNLRADLERHERAKHREVSYPQLLVGYLCDVPTCKTPDKVWERKDNFQRHLERCRKSAAKKCGEGK
jgi:hypothetical protein